MKILIVAATEQEIEPSIPILDEHCVDVLITGVGMVATAYALGQKLQSQYYDLLVNVGIAGSFSYDLPIGEVVQITQDRLIELGAEDEETFIPIEDMGFGQSLFKPTLDIQYNELTDLKRVEAITVNTVHGNAHSIQKINRMLTTITVESMEGAAVFFAAQEAGISALQIRAISNYVEPRDRSKWDIPLAIRNLNNWLYGFVSGQKKH